MLINKYRKKFNVDSMKEVIIDKMILSAIKEELSHGALTGDKLAALEKKLELKVIELRQDMADEKSGKKKPK